MTFEARLADAFDRYADRVPTDVDPFAIARDIARAASADRPVARLGGRRVSLRMAVLAAALVALLAGLAVVGSRLLEQTPDLPPPLDRPFAPAGVLSTPRGSPLLATLPDGRVLVVGGVAIDGAPAAATRRAEVFDPATSTFTPTDAITDARSILGTATTLEDGRVLIVGGLDYASQEVDEGEVVDLDSAEIYDPVTNRFSQTGSLAVPRYGHTATLLADGRVLVVGGAGNDPADVPVRARAEIYDPASGTFQTVGALLEPRTYHTATLLADGRVAIVGGFAQTDPARGLATVELFDPETGTFAAAGQLLGPRVEHTTTPLADGRLLVAGGTEGEGETIGMNALRSAELFDVASGSSTATGPMITDRQGHTATPLPDGRVAVAGGFNIDGSPRTAELYDPATGTFMLAGMATLDQGNARATLLADGRVLLVGGSGAPQLFDANLATGAVVEPPATTAFRPAGPPVTSRDGHTATLLADGRVLVVGGQTGVTGETGEPTTLGSAELYDPAADSWTLTGSLVTPRGYHAATLLADGRVLVTGGRHGFDRHLASAEIYDPATGTFSPTGEMSDPRGPLRAAPGTLGTAHLAALLPDGRVYVVGGSVTIRGGPARPELFDPATATFARVASVCEPPSGLALLPDGRVLVGCLEGGASTFDPATGEAAAADDVVAWASEAGIALGDGRTLVGDGSDRPPLLLEPDPGRWSAVSGLFGDESSGRRVTSVTVLRDGRILALGTGFGPALGPFAELFDPATGRWAPIAPPASRLSPSVTTLADGRLLIVGEPNRLPDRIYADPPVAEIFDPGAQP